MITDTTETSTAADRTVIARAWPDGRAIYPYTVQEIADGVDLYTRRLKASRICEAGGRDA